MPGTGSCSDGYGYTQGDRCHDIGAYTTCCVPYGSKEGNAGETENTVNEYSNGVAVAVCIFSAINTALLVLFLLFGGCCRRKKEESNIESQGLLLTRQSQSSTSNQIESHDRRNDYNARLPVAQIITSTQNLGGTDATFSAKPR